MPKMSEEQKKKLRRAMSLAWRSKRRLNLLEAIAKDLPFKKKAQIAPGKSNPSFAGALKLW